MWRGNGDPRERIVFKFRSRETGCVINTKKGGKDGRGE